MPCKESCVLSVPSSPVTLREGRAPGCLGLKWGPSGGRSEGAKDKVQKDPEITGKVGGSSHQWPQASCQLSWAKNSPLRGSGPRPSEGGAWKEKVLATACSRGVRGRA